jgi:hypothetical protein
MCRRCQHLIRDSIRFLFQWIVTRTNAELPLHDRHRGQRKTSALCTLIRGFALQALLFLPAGLALPARHGVVAASAFAL